MADARDSLGSLPPPVGVKRSAVCHQGAPIACCFPPPPTPCSLGLYEGLKAHGPCTAADLAAALELNER